MKFQIMRPTYKQNIIPVRIKQTKRTQSSWYPPLPNNKIPEPHIRMDQTQPLEPVKRVMNKTPQKRFKGVKAGINHPIYDKLSIPEPLQKTRLRIPDILPLTRKRVLT
jgi:hypothetical protein